MSQDKKTLTFSTDLTAWEQWYVVVTDNMTNISWLSADGDNKYLYFGSYGKSSGIWVVELDDDAVSLKADAVRMITENPARVMGISERVEIKPCRGGHRPYKA